MDEASSTWQLMAAAGFVVVNAFFVASEYAMVKVQPARLRELASSGNRRAAVALHITERLGTTIPTTQLGITVSSIALGWIGVPALARILAAPFSFLGGGLFLVRILSGMIGFLTVSFLHTVLGELAPKAISVQRAEAVALWCAIPLNAFCQVSAPFSWLLNRSAECLLGTLGLRPPSELATVAHSEEEIRMIVSSSQEQGILEEHEVELVENILDYTDRVAREIMTPRNDVRVLTPAHDICVLVPQQKTDAPLSTHLSLDKVTLPIRAGSRIGVFEVFAGQTRLAAMPLVAQGDVERLSLWRTIRERLR
jgi:CBS domain containing-hemolysin-like protein